LHQKATAKPMAEPFVLGILWAHLDQRYNKTIHLVGAQKSNYPWGFENRLIPAFESIGCKVISTDYRQQRAELPRLLMQKADLVLVCHGDGIASQLLQSTPWITALWYAEQIGTTNTFDDRAMARRHELAANVQAFDFVFTHDQGNIEVFRSLDAKGVSWLPCALVNPEVHKKLSAQKKYDVVFVGTMTPYRQKVLKQLSERNIEVYAPSLWDPIELNKLFNESRIVLNIHLSNLLNTETRVAEALGAGSFLLSEELSSPELVKEGEHYISWPSSDIDDLVKKIKYYLANETEREKIAAQGHRYAHERLTFQEGVKLLLSRIDFTYQQRIWPSHTLGILFNQKREPTLRLDDFYAAVENN
jgi:glycosyltransferase involved in cell wall biosynthesis